MTKGKKQKIQKILFIAACCFLFGMTMFFGKNCGETVYADTEPDTYIGFISDEDDNWISVAVALNEGDNEKIHVISRDLSGYAEGDIAYFVDLNDNYFEISFSGIIDEENGLDEWLSTDPNGSDYGYALYRSTPAKDSELNAQYLTGDSSEWEIQNSTTILTDADENGEDIYSISFDALNDYYEANNSLGILYEETDSGELQCAGIMISPDSAVSYWFDRKKWSNPFNLSTLTIAGIAGIAVGILLIIILVIRKNKAKKTVVEEEREVSNRPVTWVNRGQDLNAPVSPADPSASYYQQYQPAGPAPSNPGYKTNHNTREFPTDRHAGDSFDRPAPPHPSIPYSQDFHPGNDDSTVWGGETVMQPQPGQKKLGVYIKTGCLSGLIYKLDRDEILIGRQHQGQQLNLTIAYPADTRAVSRKHAKIFNHNGSLYLMDMGSSYGTYVLRNGMKERLGQGQPYPINEGSIFCIGEEKNTLEIVSMTF